MTIGQKIKSLRKKLGLTQDELACGILSRSMLSRIESGSAMPSLDSLYDIASRLDVSPGFLLEESDDLVPAERALLVKETFELLYNDEYRKCLELISLNDVSFDVHLLGVYAHCAILVGIEEFNAGNFTYAKKLFSSACEQFPKIKLPLAIASEERIRLLSQIMDNIADIENFEIDCSPDFAFQPSVFMFMLKLIKAGRHNDCSLLCEFCTLEQHYLDYINAQMLIKDYKFIDSLIILKRLALRNELPLYFRLLCLISVETCCKLCEDYKGAYETHISIEKLLNTIR